jgi:PadR family transcriptional regulator, regulatory protein PadR
LPVQGECISLPQLADDILLDPPLSRRYNEVILSLITWAMRQQELLKGNTETLLLALLELEPMYGYHIVKEMKQRSSGYFDFKEGTLYPALHRMERDHLIEGRWQDTPNGMRRRYYHITEKGRRALSDRLTEWQRFSQAMNAVMLPEL